MKNVTLIFALSGMCFVTTLITSCQKEEFSTPALSVSTNQTNEISVTKEADGSTILKLQPGPESGQDAFVQYRKDIPSSADQNFDFTNELAIFRWTFGYAPGRAKTFIKFDSLVKVPSTAKVKYAILYLYGESTSLVAPQGNSTYDGSVYNDYGTNACIVQRVNGANWNETTITWNNQPGTTENDQDTIPASTSQWKYNVALDVTAMIKKMVINPENNFGFCIRALEKEPYRNMLFSSSESSKPGLRPKLVIKYIE